jgi:hypothetical protein
MGTHKSKKTMKTNSMYFIPSTTWQCSVPFAIGISLLLGGCYSPNHLPLQDEEGTTEANADSVGDSAQTTSSTSSTSSTSDQTSTSSSSEDDSTSHSAESTGSTTSMSEDDSTSSSSGVGSTGREDGCTPGDECQIDDDCATGETCLADCTCFGRGNGDDCPSGQECLETNEGHFCAQEFGCGLVCQGAATCPNGMECHNTVGLPLCGYPLADLPAPGDPEYPPPALVGLQFSCPNGTELFVTHMQGTEPVNAICAPSCAAMCPMASSGSALETCLIAVDNPPTMCTP